MLNWLCSILFIQYPGKNFNSSSLRMRQLKWHLNYYELACWVWFHKNLHCYTKWSNQFDSTCCIYHLTTYDTETWHFNFSSGTDSTSFHGLLWVETQYKSLYVSILKLKQLKIWIDFCVDRLSFLTSWRIAITVTISVWFQYEYWFQHSFLFRRELSMLPHARIVTRTSIPWENIWPKNQSARAHTVKVNLKPLKT